MLKILGTIAKFIVIGYAAIFMLLVGMIIMTNIMLSGLS